MFRTLLLLTFISISEYSSAQAVTDSNSVLVQKLPLQYLKDTEKKINRYSNRVSSKTIKTLTKLSKWEAKVQRLLQKTSPETARKLFSNSSLSFKSMLEQYKKGEAVIKGYKTGYDEYRDQLSTQFKYLDSNKNLLSKTHQQLIAKNKAKTDELEEEEKQNEALQKMIRERKKQLVAEAMKNLGKNKQLQKINKETYYYAETIKNYKQLFKDRNKREETAKKVLDKIPGFKKFMRDNSLLGSMFRMPNSSGVAQNIPGLQTRNSVGAIFQDRIGLGNPNVNQQMQQKLQQGQSELNKLKDKMTGGLGNSSDLEMPDFKVNTQKTKTFFQRLEYGANVQFEKSSNYFPSTSNLAFTIGYKVNDKTSAGLGIAAKVGLGRGWDKLQFTGEGLGLRSYIDWKMKKKLFLSAGYEQNYNASIKNIRQLKDYSAWTSSGLIGISKEYQAIKTKKGKLQVLFDVFAHKQIPRVSPIKIRTGISIK